MRGNVFGHFFLKQERLLVQLSCLLETSSSCLQISDFNTSLGVEGRLLATFIASIGGGGSLETFNGRVF